MARSLVSTAFIMSGTVAGSVSLVSVISEEMSEERFSFEHPPSVRQSSVRKDNMIDAELCMICDGFTDCIFLMTLV